ncbi:hypothetical protein KYI07_11620 (plasmid) [Macrococcus psychrotolerans]|uniref:DUF4190 domain-containing protein n=1 Tax=Macrococcus psychrotolerans TaxID=3039389 RepID=A0AAT9P805_9STAP|nr:MULTISPECIES: hypothetical protein [Macrococcus]QYA34063.1 hypothetical protein KYI10_11735 [Macrococcus sp. 19Msa1099]QYA38848.1 hypothetical protein KYI07_11620 [Macrococcus caseolyticus]QYA77571.1 hypothetical protein KYI12_11710 [Macrococcus caseolyticus]
MDTLTETLQALSPSMKLLLSAVIGIAGLFFGAKTGIKAQAAFSDKNISEGLLFLALTLVIFAIGIILFVMIWGIAQNTGNDFNSEFGFILPFLNQ